MRAIPAGIITAKAVTVFVAVSAALLVVAAWRLNPLAFALSPVALVTIMGYSYAKRFTSFAHIWLGLALAIAPVGAWIAVVGRFDLLPLLLGLAVLLWVSGFDIIYACQDVQFDTGRGLHSIPTRLGIRGSLILSAVLHVLMMGVLIAIPSVAARSGITLGLPYWIGLKAVAALLTYEHVIVRPTDLSRVNAAFFTMNGVISLVLMAACVLDVLYW
jgi:4-hydroxybenzoate polyprenyltransferase